ncbi:PREDICTED: uncharacterized protein LOC104597001 [Nelumbo nucifera]|uniref:Uncharacterized protein LOC104597001 n=1 Tax=Nelumbo nucifera TaxID=4432 RepID=A0A1U8A4F8_NELNU|nr:PREDICTED: uncharacterized protein LOC104597001 [Nelumbo nucifera]
MNALKAIQTPFSPTLKFIQTPFSPTLKFIQTPLSLTINVFVYKKNHLTKKRISILPLSKASDAGSESSPPPEGDARKQELLARIAMLQAQKVRLTDYLDERSAYLTQFAEDANAEFDEIGENALKDLDEAGARIMENLENRMQALEETAASNRQEIAKNERKLVEFEDQMEKDRNEGLFFKNLRQRAPGQRAKAKEETKKIRELTKENAGSKIRRSIYLALIALLVIVIADALISTSLDWRKVAVLGAILVGLFAQFTYEQMMSSTSERTRKEEEQK